MASFGDFTLPVKDPDFVQGAGFYLNRPSPIDFSWDCPRTHRRVSIVRDSPVLTVAHRPPLATDSLLSDSQTTAQESLDLLGIRKRVFLCLPRFQYDNLLWWTCNDEAIVRLSNSANMRLRVEASWALGGATGIERRSEDEPLPHWHESFRYFRYSQLGNSLYGAYRDMFLAVESLLSSSYPKNPGERESDWHERANRGLTAKGLDFSSLVSAPGSDNVATFVAQQFRAQRCAHFHAKAGQARFVPGVPSDAAMVATALEQLGRYYAEACGRLLGTGTSVGVVTLNGIQMAVNTFRDQLKFVVSSDPTEASVEDTEVSPQGYPVSPVPTSYLGIVDGVGYHHGFEGRILTRDLCEPVIRTVAARVPEALMTRERIPDLNLDGITRLELSQVWCLDDHAGLKGGFEL